MYILFQIIKDIEELTKLEGEATRSRVKDLLKLEIRRLQTELVKREEKKAAEEKAAAEQANGEGAAPAAAKPITESSSRVFKELIKNYGMFSNLKMLLNCKLIS